MPQAANDDDIYAVTACDGIRQFELTVTEAAQVTARKAVGFCDRRQDGGLCAASSDRGQRRLAAADRLEPESCQRIADWLQYQKPITFREESAELSDNDLAQIALLAGTLKKCGSTRVLIEGHTSKIRQRGNQSGTERKTCARRAEGPRRSGCSAQRLTARGFGEAHPRFAIAEDDNLNRRIEINLEWDQSSRS